MSDAIATDELWRSVTPQVIGALVRRYRDFDRAEEAAQEALLAAAVQWPEQGVPDDPKAWLIRVASRRLIDGLRSDEARVRRELADATQAPADDLVAPPPDAVGAPGHDDSLTLLLLCCHPSLTPPARIALTLRAVGGLTTAQIAHAFLVPEATMAQRISRAKQRIRESGAEFRMPPPDELPARMSEVLHVLYLVFTEGHTASSGQRLHRIDLTAEAIRLTRQAHILLPDDGEVAGLLALMLLTEARRRARTNAAGELVPLAEQDRSLWDTAYIREGVALVTDALTRTRLGPYQVQAAIAAVHDEAPTAADTDWEQVLTLYGVLERLAPGPVVSLNRAVALAMVEGPAAGLAVLEDLAHDKRLAGHHRLHAVRAHLLELAGDAESARESYLLASRLTTSIPEQDHLRRRAEAL
ncbi:RNA polymerase sigma factor [Terrabacter sp. MAHUQ-38]|uniref:RNA polymerase sigma factor n=1 Tax=unclassified Terrabacter TaxID=2630222 RepID=UPI00165E35E3|nr:sigma-70 family RNA polymerase sigma factor [Terrabacter sp. MAHUQ-38]MBC9820403.1 sigma-70 family RNA polymerase sigma factor [Terrabacter sp. MAHUQ-38]